VICSHCQRFLYRLLYEQLVVPKAELIWSPYLSILQLDPFLAPVVTLGSSLSFWPVDPTQSAPGCTMGGVYCIPTKPPPPVPPACSSRCFICFRFSTMFYPPPLPRIFGKDVSFRQAFIRGLSLLAALPPDPHGASVFAGFARLFHLPPVLNADVFRVPSPAHFLAAPY